MAIDLGRVIQAALEAATQGPSSEGEVKKRRPHLSSGRALLLGAGLLTVGRLAAPKGREMLNALQQTSTEHEGDEDFEEEEEPEGEGDEDFEEEEEPEGEGDEDFEEEEEPEGEGDEDFEEEESRS